MVSLKQILRDKDYIIGGVASEWLRPSVVKLYKQAGFDFIFVEYEHMFINPERLADFVICARDNNVPVVAKVPELHRHLLLKMLETGILGIQLPRTNTAADVKGLINLAKYPPVGTRAGLTGTGAADYIHLSVSEHLKKVNEELLIIGHVETRQGVENIEEIAAVPGLDVIYIGTLDLAIDLGTPDDLNSPAVLAAVDRICAACKKHGVIVGGNGLDGESVRLLRRKGLRFFEGLSELEMFSMGASQFRKSLP